MVYLLPHISEPLFRMLVLGGWFGLALTNLWWTFIISEKYRLFTSTRFSHFTFSYLFIMNLKYFVTSRHHSGAIISSMRQILNYLLGKLLQACRCFKQDKDWNIFRNFRFLDWFHWSSPSSQSIRSAKQPWGKTATLNVTFIHFN